MDTSSQMARSLEAEDFRASAIAGLTAHGAAAVPALKCALRDPSPKVRLSAARTGGAIGKPASAAVPDLATALDDGDFDVARAAAKAIGSMALLGVGAVPALTRALRRPCPELRVSIVISLGRMGSPGLPALIRAMKDPDPHVRFEAAKSLGHLGPEARPALREVRCMVDDPHPAVRRWARWARDRMESGAVLASA